MSAKITFLAKSLGDDAATAKLMLTVPAAAVAERNGRQVVYQLKGDHAVEIPVTVGQRIGAQIEIKNGLKEGDKIIGKIDETLRAGAKVAVKNP
jgi:anti-sigma factor RsiW